MYEQITYIGNHTSKYGSLLPAPQAIRRCPLPLSKGKKHQPPKREDYLQRSPSIHWLRQPDVGFFIIVVMRNDRAIKCILQAVIQKIFRSGKREASEWKRQKMIKHSYLLRFDCLTLLRIFNYFCAKRYVASHTPINKSLMETGSEDALLLRTGTQKRNIITLFFCFSVRLNGFA